MPNLAWERLSQEKIWNGHRKLENWRFRLPTGIEADFEIVTAGAVVCTLAITESDTVVLARQFRPGPGAVLDELPGGMIDPGEDPETAAARELLEETGYAGDLRFVSTSFSEAYTTLTRHNFVATNARKVAEPQHHEREPIEVIELPLAEFREHLRRGRLTDMGTGYAGLDFLGLL